MAELDPLPDDIQALLARAQAGAPPPPPGAEDAVLAKVGATVAATVGATVGAPLAAGAAAVSVGWVKPLVGLAVAALGVVSVVGVVSVLRGAPAAAPVSAPASAPPPAVVAPTPAPIAPAREPPVAAAPSVDVAADAAAVADVGAEAQAPAPADTPRAATARGTRPAEGPLLEAARDALSRGDADLALAKLEAHQKQFGARGRLVEERHALTVVAFAQKGDHARAQSAADAFLRLYPNSLFGDTVRAAVAPR